MTRQVLFANTPMARRNLDRSHRVAVEQLRADPAELTSIRQ
jgi:hypothetical protein